MARRWYPRDANLTILSGNSTALTADDDDGLGTGNVILDLGSGRFDAVLVFDVTALDIVSNDEAYNIIVQVSNSATFASGIEEAARRLLGATEVRKGAGDSAVGRYEMPFTNDVNGTEYRHARVLVDVAGTTPSITISNMWATLNAEGIA